MPPLSYLTLLVLTLCSSAQDKKPNVIYILADDLGYGDLSCYGQDKLSTPNIDRLANEGIKFTNHYSGNTVCSPSRAVLMTGIESGRLYLRGNIWKEKGCALPPQLTVMPEVFKNAGYRTGCFGKWGLGVTNGSKRELPSTHGFDEYVGWKSQLIAHTYYPSSYIRNGEEIPLDGDSYLNPIIMDSARGFIADCARNEEPFFCYIPTAIPHAAMHGPAELHEKWRKKLPQFDHLIGKYGAGKEEHTPDVINPVAGFAAMIEYLDNEVGRILALVEKLGIDDNTIILFASDNGPSKEGGHKTDFWNSSGGLRGHKRLMYEGGIRSPLLARWPNQIEANTQSDHLCGFHDMLSTFAELAGEATPEQNTGLSILPTLLDEGEQKEHECLFIEFRKEKKLFSQALRFGNWKAYKQAEKKIELYNLAEDPTEKQNLASEPAYADVVSQAKKLIEQSSIPLEKTIQ